MSSEEPTFDINNNLFEGYSDYDLSFLRGFAFLIPMQDIKTLSKPQDHVIKFAHKYYSKEFEYCGGSAEKRLEALFNLKDKWTKGEIEAYLKPFIDLNVKLDTYLMKNTRMIKE